MTSPGPVPSRLPVNLSVFVAPAHALNFLFGRFGACSSLQANQNSRTKVCVVLKRERVAAARHYLLLLLWSAEEKTGFRRQRWQSAEVLGLTGEV